MPGESDSFDSRNTDTSSDEEMLSDDLTTDDEGDLNQEEAAAQCWIADNPEAQSNDVEPSSTLEHLKFTFEVNHLVRWPHPPSSSFSLLVSQDWDGTHEFNIRWDDSCRHLNTPAKV